MNFGVQIETFKFMLNSTHSQSITTLKLEFLFKISRFQFKFKIRIKIFILIISYFIAYK